jgi:hypothetical protein
MIEDTLLFQTDIVSLQTVVTLWTGGHCGNRSSSHENSDQPDAEMGSFECNLNEFCPKKWAYSIA